MRGSSDPQLAMLTSVSTEDLIPPDHPIRKIRVVVDAASSSPPWSARPKLRRYISSEHFTVDGTLLKAWASHKSFKPKDGAALGPAGRTQR